MVKIIALSLLLSAFLFAGCANSPGVYKLKSNNAPSNSNTAGGSSSSSSSSSEIDD